MSPLPPARKAKVGPFRPDVEKRSPLPKAIIGIDSIDVPACVQSSSPVAGSYDVIALEPLKISSSRSPIRSRTGFDQPIEFFRSRCQTVLPVRLSNAAHSDFPLF